MSLHWNNCRTLNKASKTTSYKLWVTTLIVLSCSLVYIWKHSEKCKELCNIILNILMPNILLLHVAVFNEPCLLRKLSPKEALRKDACKINASQRPSSHVTRTVVNSIVYDLWYLWTTVIRWFFFFQLYLDRLSAQ